MLMMKLKTGVMMSKIKVKSYNAFQYLSVFEIIEWREGCIYKTKDTNKCIHSKDKDKLDQQKYTTTSLSTSLTKLNEFEIELL